MDIQKRVNITSTHNNTQKKARTNSDEVKKIAARNLLSLKNYNEKSHLTHKDEYLTTISSENFFNNIEEGKIISGTTHNLKIKRTTAYPYDFSYFSPEPQKTPLIELKFIEKIENKLSHTIKESKEYSKVKTAIESFYLEFNQKKRYDRFDIKINEETVTDSALDNLLSTVFIDYLNSIQSDIDNNLSNFEIRKSLIHSIHNLILNELNGEGKFNFQKNNLTSIMGKTKSSYNMMVNYLKSTKTIANLFQNLVDLGFKFREISPMLHSAGNRMLTQTFREGLIELVNKYNKLKFETKDIVLILTHCPGSISVRMEILNTNYMKISSLIEIYNISPLIITELIISSKDAAEVKAKIDNFLL